jgi:hypothetical protein
MRAFGEFARIVGARERAKNKKRRKQEDKATRTHPAPSG